MKIVSKKLVGKRHVYDITVDDNHNFVANGIVAHNSGARKFCMQAKPRDIADLAAITAIYRPGPLKANVHNMYVDAGKNLDKIKYDHPLIEKVLGPTRGFIAFQEQFMSLAVELAGFSPGESDQMRKTLVKKSLDTLDKKSGEKAMLRDKFVKGAKEKLGLSEDITNALFDKIEFFSLYGFNKSLYFGESIDTYNQDGSLRARKTIEAVEAGDLVLTRDEQTRENVLTTVVARHDHSCLDLVEVELTSGEKVRCTWDHKFRTIETGEMMPLWQIQQMGLSIVVHAEKSSDRAEVGNCTALDVR